MNRSLEEARKSFLEKTERIQQIGEAVALMYWDLRTGAPVNGVAHRSAVIGTLSTDIFRLSTDEEMKVDLEVLEKPENLQQLSDIEKALVRECRKEYDRYMKIPEHLYKEYVILTSEAESAWEGCKGNNDFPGFKPYLEKIIDFNKKFIALWGYKEHPYDTLLDYYEPGMTVAQLDRIFSEVRVRTVALMKKIESANVRIDDTIFSRAHFAAEKQEKLSLKMLEAIEFDLNSGKLEESEHPFTSGIASPNDVRLTTKYHTDNLSSALLSTLHEGGHGLYEQNVAKALEGTILATGTSMGIHESQSRFFENVIGRSPEFWKAYYGDVQEVFGAELQGVSGDEFYKALNKVTPSLIRIEADELTYNLHIMVRYEIEKGLFEGSIQVDDLPMVWKAKMKEYLGIEPKDDKTGVLQDVHWAGGLFGYFPSYSLGNMYAAQFLKHLEKDLPEYRSLVADRKIGPIKQWMVDKVHVHGKMKNPGSIVLEATGEALSSKYLMDYLEEKFSRIYGI